jgi:hypothetical protein
MDSKCILIQLFNVACFLACNIENLGMGLGMRLAKVKATVANGLFGQETPAINFTLEKSIIELTGSFVRDTH